MNIFEKMAAITAELQTVAKNLTVQTTKTSSYKAVSERDILDAVKPLEAKYGVYSYPCGRTLLESHLLESESEYNGKVTKKTTFMTRIATVYRFVNIEKPEEYIETTTFAEGIDSQDKGSGKAMTYGDKYALMKGYKISTGDDPDQTASVETRYSRAETFDATERRAARPNVLPNTATTASSADALRASIDEKVDTLAKLWAKAPGQIKVDACNILKVTGSNDGELAMIDRWLDEQLQKAGVA